MRASANPYLNRTAIKDHRNFFGRRRELATIFTRIDATEPQSVSIIGERKVGKSSLLRAILPNRAAFLRRPDTYIFVYCDLQERVHGDVAGFFAVLMEDIALARQAPAIAEKPPTYENFRKLVAELARSGLRLVLLLDEFDAVTQNHNFTLEFFSFLRSMPNNYLVSYIVSSANELQEFCHSKEIAGSPFFNIFHKLNLGCFSPPEAMELICRPSQEAGSPLEPHADTIIRLAGYFPFFLQLACCGMFELLTEGPKRDTPDWELLRQRFREEALDHFEYIWDHLSARERAVCRKIAKRQSFDHSDLIFMANLKRRGYVSDIEGGGVALFSGVFESFLLEKEARQGGRASYAAGVAARSVLKEHQGGIWNLTGATVGRFVVRSLLGSGAMGEVYLADDTILKRPVALKRMASIYREDPEYRRRFLKEAERASQLSDPRIAGIYDLLEEGGELFLVMEYVDGRTLRERLKEPLSPRQLLPIAEQCACALAVAHKKGIVHCDIKPENILLTSLEQVKILDFGLAKHLRQEVAKPMSKTASAITEIFGGTPGYIAPELLMDLKADPRCDIFSLGVVCYESLAGEHPFRSQTCVQTFDRILHQEPRRLKETVAGIGDELDRIVMTCLEKNPELRYQSAGELAAALSQIRFQGFR